MSPPQNKSISLISEKPEPGAWKEIPSTFLDLSLYLDPNGKYITCGVCQEHDTRKSSQDGRVACTRGRFFKFDALKEHVLTEYHVEAIKRRNKLRDSKAVLNGTMTKDEFELLHHCKWQSPTKKQKLTIFFKFLPKPVKNSQAPCGTSSSKLKL